MNRQCALLVGFMALFTSATALGQVSLLPDVNYSQYANQQPLERTLREFAKTFRLEVDIAPGVDGVVNGHFTTRTPTEFIDRLAGAYGLSWFVHAGVLHIARLSDTITRGIQLPGGSTGSVHRALGDLGVLDSRFGWGELPEQDLVFVSGPPAYVDIVRDVLASLPSAPGGQQVRLFHLKHASVSDREVRYRDKQVVTPGLATVLRDLTEVGGQVERTSTPDTFHVSTNAPLAQAPVMSPLAAEPPPLVSPTTRPNAPRSSSRRAHILAEPRMNAIIIQDTPERMPMYEKLIAELDVPTQLVEIEAMIIDVSSEHTEELGIGWSSRSGGTAVTLGDVAIPADGSVVTLAKGISPTASALDVGRYLLARIHALEVRGEAEIQSRPSVLTGDNEGALIDLSQTFYIQSTGERVATVTPVTAGTQLNVTPKIVEMPGGRRAIQLAVHIEDGQVEQTSPNALPTVISSVVDTQAVVANDATLTLGGYRTNASTKSHSQVPLLGSLPVVGKLFSSDDTERKKRDRIFMIRPRIVSLDMAVSSTAVSVPQSATTVPIAE